MASWEQIVAASPDEFELIQARVEGGSKNLRSLNEFSFGRMLGGHAPSEYLIKLSDAWISAGDLDKALQLKESGVAEFQYKGKVSLVPPVSWSTAKGENNYGWQLHSLTFLQGLVKLHREAQDVEAFDLLKQIMRDWSNQNVRLPYPSLLSWNDHATAIRLGVIGHIYVYLLRTETDDVEFLKFLLLLAARHQAILRDESFYSKGTNHGLDQAFQLFISAITFPLFVAAQDNLDTAKSRLKYEVDGAFSADGVHVENSPQYHPVILSSILQVNASVSRLGGVPIIESLEAFVPLALKFLAYVLRPDGCFPAIGDSEIAPVRNNLTWLSAYKGYDEFEFARSGGARGVDFGEWHAVFKDSGYAVFRGESGAFEVAERPHIVFKCGFLSRYHRQDDDTSLVLAALGEDWLIDGGLYIHDHGVPAREYLRSPLAHNLLMPAGAVATRAPGDGRISRLTDARVDNRDARITGETRMFPGFAVRRTLSYAGGLELEVEDSVESDDPGSQLYWQFWQIPGEHSVTVSRTGFTVKSERTGNTMSVSLDSENLVYLGRATEATGSLGVYSRKYNKLESAIVIRADLVGSGSIQVRARIQLVRG